MNNKLYALTLLVIFPVIVCSAGVAQENPNVLFIAVDDLNDWIGVLDGHPQAITPNLDKLGERGVYFTEAHCSAPVCNSSRHSLMSGLHPANTGWFSTGLRALRDSATYAQGLHGVAPMPNHFRNNGYKTLAAGKIFHNGVQDFDWDYWDEAMPKKYQLPEWARGGHFAPYPKDGGAFRKKYAGQDVSGKSLCWAAWEEGDLSHGMPDEQIVQWGIDQLGRDYEKPFFMAIGFLRPHVPYTAPKAFFDLYPLDSIQLPEVPVDEMADIPIYGKAMAYGALPNGDHREVLDMSPTYWKELVRAYLACVSFVDAQIGRLISALDESDYADNTVIVLWSDHGQHLGEKKHWRKQCLWEEATHVPLFFSYPGMKHQGVQCDEPVSLIDIFPTLSAICDLPPQALDGVNLKPILDDPARQRGRPVLTTRYYKNHSLRTSEWRYIRYRDGGEELYNRIADPGEHSNLSEHEQYHDVLKTFRSLLPGKNALPPNQTATYAPDRYDRLVDRFNTEGIPVWLR